MVRTRTDEVSILGRNTQGVRVIRTKEGEVLVGVERIDEPAPDAELLSAESSEAPVADIQAPVESSDETDNETGDDNAE